MDKQPSSFHLAQRVIWKAQLHAEHILNDAKLEVEIIEYRERRDDPEAMAMVVELIRRVK